MAVYQRNFLNKVIWRVDLPSPFTKDLSEIKTHINTSFGEGVEVKNKQVGVRYDGKEDKVTEIREEIVSWRFQKSGARKRFEIGPSYCFLEYDQYQDSTELLSDVTLVAQALAELYQVETLSRVGMRYQNVIAIPPSETPLNWKDYVSSDLLSGMHFGTPEMTAALARSMGNTIYNLDDCMLNFNFGIWNPDFPAKNVQREFILDFDCYSVLQINLHDTPLVEITRRYNKTIETYFETSITSNLRNVLNTIEPDTKV